MSRQSAIRPPAVVWLDVDDILLDFCGMYNKHLSGLGYSSPGRKRGIPEGYYPDNWNYSEIVSQEEHRDVFGTLPVDWPASLRAHGGSIGFTWRLHEAGARVVLVTSLPQTKALYRMRNLLAHGFYFDEIYFTGHGEAQSKEEYVEALMQRFPASRHIFVDDRGETCLAFAKHFGNSRIDVHTVDRPYNKKFSEEFDTWGCIRVHDSLDELYRHIFEVVIGTGD